MSDIEELNVLDLYLNHNKSFHSFDSKEKELYWEGLLNWFKKNRRRLPWRGDDPPYSNSILESKKQNNPKQPSISSFFAPKAKKDNSNKSTSDIQLITDESKPLCSSPYGIWISEVMLQQTRVETVIDYYIKWMSQFPDIKTLSESTEDEVCKLWSGLGYYNRAKNLLKGAKYVVENYDGILPDDVDKLMKIPGIGKYTAGAIASIAFNKAEPVVDGNVERIFTRLFCMISSVDNSSLISYVWTLATDLMNSKTPSIYNQALMEFGAIICTPQNPQCSICPLNSICKSKRISTMTKTLNCESIECEICVKRDKIPNFTTQSLPLPKEKQMKIQQSFITLSDKINFLLSQRTDTGILKNQWEFINIEIEDNKTEKEIKELINETLDGFVSDYEYGKWKINYKGEIKHTITNHNIKYKVYLVEVGNLKKIKLKESNMKIYSSDEMNDLCLTSAISKILNLLGNKKIKENPMKENRQSKKVKIN